MGEGSARSGEDIYWGQLETSLRERCARLAGAAGLCLLEPRGGRRLEIDADVEFATASSIKIPVLAALLLRVQRGEIRLQERHAIRAEDHVGGSGVLQTFADGVEVSVRDLARLMIRYSDNTATNACIDLAGGPSAVNGLLDGLGLRRTRLRRRMMDAQAVARGQENVSTAAEMARLIKRLLADGEVLDAPMRSVATEILCLSKDSPFSVLARPDMAVADKPGTLEGIRCDVGYFFQARRPYALAIMTAYGTERADGWLRATARHIADAMAVLDRSGPGGRRLAGEGLRP